MKKIYLQPSICIDIIEEESDLLTASTNGNAGEEHAGDNTGGKDPHTETTPEIGGTGDDDGFIMGSKGGFDFEW